MSIVDEPISGRLKKVHARALAEMRKYAQPYDDFNQLTANLRRLADGESRPRLRTEGYTFYTCIHNRDHMVKVPNRHEVDSMNDAAEDKENGLVVATFINQELVSHRFSDVEVGVFVCVTVIKGTNLGAMHRRCDGAPVRFGCPKGQPKYWTLKESGTHIVRQRPKTRRGTRAVK